MLQFYGLREQPFGTTPDPRYFYPLAANVEALASLKSAVEYRVGFAALIAEPGLGKTTILFDLLDHYRGTAATAFIFNTQCDAAWLLKQIAEDLGVASSNNAAQTHENLKQFVALHSDPQPVLIVIDEAQNMEDEALEAVRLLSDFETADCKLLHIVLAGQPQLLTKLSQPHLVQLWQRVTMMAQLQRLTLAETTGYIHHRLQVAGGNESLFDESAIKMIAERSGGTPRDINRLCFNSLLLGCALRRRTIDEATVAEVVGDRQMTPVAEAPPPPAAAIDDFRPSRWDVPPPSQWQPTIAQEGTVIPEFREHVASVAPIAFAKAERGLAQSTSVARAVMQPAAAPTVMPTQSAPKLVAMPVAAPKPERIPTPIYQRNELRDIFVNDSTASFSTPDRDPLFRRMLEWVQDHAIALTVAIVSVVGSSGGLLWVRTMAVAPSRAELPPPVIASPAVVQPPTVEVVALPSERRRRVRKPEEPVSAAPAGVSAAASTPAAKAGPSAVSAPAPGEKASDALVFLSGRTPTAGLVPAKLIGRVRPDYPKIARQMGIEGEVQMMIMVGTDGKVRSVHVERGAPQLMQAAVDAVSQWVYQPATLNGHNIPTQLPVSVKFSLSQP
jgi:TonB family protein